MYANLQSKGLFIQLASHPATIPMTPEIARYLNAVPFQSSEVGWKELEEHHVQMGPQSKAVLFYQQTL